MGPMGSGMVGLWAPIGNRISHRSLFHKRSKKQKIENKFRRDGRKDFRQQKFAREIIGRKKFRRTDRTFSDRGHFSDEKSSDEKNSDGKVSDGQFSDGKISGARSGGLMIRERQQQKKKNVGCFIRCVFVFVFV